MGTPTEAICIRFLPHGGEAARGRETGGGADDMAMLGPPRPTMAPEVGAKQLPRESSRHGARMSDSLVADDLAQRWRSGSGSGGRAKTPLAAAGHKATLCPGCSSAQLQLPSSSDPLHPAEIYSRASEPGNNLLTKPHPRQVL